MVENCKKFITLLLLERDVAGKKIWVTHIRELLCKNGFGYVWNEQTVENNEEFIRCFTQRHKDCYMHDWSENWRAARKLTFNRSFKLNFEMETYVTSIDIKKFRKVLSQFRISNNKLMVELGRQNNIPANERFCTYRPNR